MPCPVTMQGSDEEAASPTIPAHRTEFDPSPAPPRPALPSLLGLIPRLGLPGKPSPAPEALGATGGSPGATHAAGTQQQQEGGRPSMAIPRLNLAGSMHSNLETRTASAELQVCQSCIVQAAWNMLHPH